jgi:hypothetical protein
VRDIGQDSNLVMELYSASLMSGYGKPADEIADRYEQIRLAYASRPASTPLAVAHNVEMVELVAILVKQYRCQAGKTSQAAE